MSLATLHTVKIMALKKFRSGTGAGSGKIGPNPILTLFFNVQVLGLNSSVVEP
jgi:hypothetical protein